MAIKVHTPNSVCHDPSFILAIQILSQNFKLVVGGRFTFQPSGGLGPYSAELQSNGFIHCKCERLLEPHGETPHRFNYGV